MSSHLFRVKTSLKANLKEGVENYTDTYTKTEDHPDYQFGDVTKTTALRAWNGVAGGFQRHIIMRITNAEEPATTLMSYINTCRHQNGKEVFTIDKGRGHDLWTLMVKRFTPLEVAHFSSSWWRSGMEGDNVWEMPEFNSFRILLPYLE